jgi:hypothetical protein
MPQMPQMPQMNGVDATMRPWVPPPRVPALSPERAQLAHTAHLARGVAARGDPLQN